VINARHTLGLYNSTIAIAKQYMMTVDHSGCKPAVCSSRSGHHETPQMNALISKTPTGKIFAMLYLQI
jgi:hypothetical protein